MIDLKAEIKALEKKLIREALEKTNGLVTKAAKELGLTHQRLNYIINHRHKDLLTVRTPVRRRTVFTNGEPKNWIVVATVTGEKHSHRFYWAKHEPPFTHMPDLALRMTQATARRVANANNREKLTYGAAMPAGGTYSWEWTAEPETKEESK